MEKRTVYADNAATTRITPPVLEAMMPWLQNGYGNPSSIYALGREARVAIETARGQVAAALGCGKEEVFFTSCGCEADNWAIKGAAALQKNRGKTHIITTAFEHHAVLHTCQALEKDGYSVTYLPVDEHGLLTPAQVEEAIRPETGLVTIMYANNEIGTILPIGEIGAICKAKNVLFHTDAVQAIGHVDMNVKADNLDMLTLSGHKFHAPKGVGALYIRKGLRIPNLIDGGGQENNRRAGTENVASIVAMGKAIEIASAGIADRNAKVAEMRNRLMNEILKIPASRLNGDPVCRLPGNVNISFRGIEGEGLLLLLDMAGISASSGSACTSGSLDPSHVLLSIGLPHEIAHGSLRLTIDDATTEEDIDYIIAQLPPIVARLRAMSPIWNENDANQ